MPEEQLGLGIVFKGTISRSLDAAVARLEKTLTGINTALGGQAKTTSQATQNMQSYGKSASSASQQLGKLSSRSTAAGKATRGLGTNLLHVRDTARAAETWIGRLGYALKSMMAWIPAAIAVSTFIQAIQGGVVAIKDFDQALYNVGAITNATTAEMSAMGDKMFDVANTTKFSAAEVGEAAVLIGQAGFSASEAINTLEATAMLATGTLSDMATSADLVTTALRVFSLDASESMRVADVFANAVNRSKMTIDKLRISLNYIGPVAASAGLEIEEVAAATMALANAGIRASTIGTGFRQTLARLLAPNAKLRAAIQETGKSLEEFDVTTRGLGPVLQSLGETLRGDAGLALQIFGLRAGNAAILLSQLGEDGFNYLATVAGEAGTAVRMAERQMEGLGVSTKNLMDKLTNLAISIGEGGLLTVLKTVVDSLRVFVDIIGGVLRTELGKAVITFVSVTASLYGMVKVLGLLKKAIISLGISSLITGFRGVGAAISMAVLPSQKLIAAFAALRVAFAYTGVGLFVIVLGALFTALMRVRSAQDDARVSLQKSASLHRENADSVSKYAERLRDARDNNDKYRSTLERLVNTYPQLRGEIEKAGDSISNQLKVIDDYAEAEGKIAKKESREAIKMLAEELRNSKDRYVELSEELQVASKGMTGWDYAVEGSIAILSGLGAGIGGVIDLVSNFLNVISFGLIPATNEASRHWETFTKSLRRVLGPLGLMKEEKKAVIDQMISEKEQGKKLTQELLRMGEAYGTVEEAERAYREEGILDDEEIQRMIEGRKALEAFNNRVMEFGELSAKADKDFGTLIASMNAFGDEDLSGIAKNYEDLYLSMGESGRKFLAEFSDQLLEKEQKIEAQAEKEKWDTDQLVEELTKLYKEGYDEILDDIADFADDAVDIIRGLYDDQKSVLESSYDDQLDELKSHYKERAALAQASTVEEERALDRLQIIQRDYWNEADNIAFFHYDELNRLMEERVRREKEQATDLILNQEDLSDKLVEIERQANEEKIDLANDYRDELTSIYDEVAKAYTESVKSAQEAQEKMYSNSKDFEEKIDDLRVSRLDKEKQTSAQQRLIDKEYDKFSENMIFGRLNRAQDNIDRLEDLYGSLTHYKVETTEEGERKIRKDTDATIESQIQGLKKLQGLQQNLDSSLATSREQAANEYKAKLEELSTSIESIGTSIDELSSKQLTLNAEGALASIRELSEVLGSAKFKAAVQFVGTTAPGVGGDEFPIEESVTKVRDALGNITETITEWKMGDGSAIVIKVMSKFAEGGEGIFISDLPTQLSSQFDIVRNTLGEKEDMNAPDLLIKGRNEEGSESVFVSNLLDDTASKVDTFYADISGKEAKLVVDAEEAIKDTTTVKEITDELMEESPYNVDVNINVTGLVMLERALSVYRELRDKTVTVTINTVQRESKRWGGLVKGYQHGGKIPGYGGGDRVDVKAEAGEYVLPKESTRKYGVGFLELLRKQAIPTDLVGKLMQKVSSLGDNINIPNIVNNFSAPGIPGLGSNEQIFTVKLQTDNAELPMKVLGDPNQTAFGIRQFEKMLNKRRLRRG